MAADLGSQIDLYQPFRDFEGMPDAEHARNLERAERKFDLMQALGAATMLVCSNTSPRSSTIRSAAPLSSTSSPSAPRGATCGSATRRWPGGRHVNRYRPAWSIVERADHPHLGLILDSFHTLSLRDDPSAIAAIPGEKIFFCRWPTRRSWRWTSFQWARHHRCFPGQGQFDLERFLALVLRAGYAGPLSLEIFNDVFPRTPNRRTATDAMRSLLLPRKARRGSASSARRGSGGDRRRSRRRAHRAVRSARRRRASAATRSWSSPSTRRPRATSPACSEQLGFAPPGAIARRRSRSGARDRSA
jgi:4-hydroxyphenylpyruvate dioxygenase